MQESERSCRKRYQERARLLGINIGVRVLKRAVIFVRNNNTIRYGNDETNNGEGLGASG